MPTRTVKIVAGVEYALAEPRIRHVQTVARGILDCPNDPRHEEAGQMLALITEAVRAGRRGWGFAEVMRQIEALAQKANAKIVEPVLDQAFENKDRLATEARNANNRRHAEAEKRWAEWRRWDEKHNKTLKSKRARATRVADHFGLPDAAIQNIAKKLVERT